MKNNDKFLDTFMKTRRDQIAQELFNKNDGELQFSEYQRVSEYIHDLDNPVWKPIMYNENKTNFEISNIGTIRNIRTNKLLSTSLNKKGYPTIALWIDGKQRPYTIHRLVAIAFIPNPENKPQVNHINGKKTCNWVGNLEWATQSENIRHAINTGLMKAPGKGSDGRNCKNTEENVHATCKLLEKGTPISKICKQLGVTRAFVIGIKYRGNWTDIRSQYDIPVSGTYTNHSEELIQKMDELIDAGHRNRKWILEQVGLPVNKTNISYLKYRIKIHNGILRRSTTIGQLQ